MKRCDTFDCNGHCKANGKPCPFEKLEHQREILVKIINMAEGIRIMAHCMAAVAFIALITLLLTGCSSPSGPKVIGYSKFGDELYEGYMECPNGEPSPMKALNVINMTHRNKTHSERLAYCARV